MYESPSTANAQPNPTVTTSAPARAGPMTRDEVMSALLRLTALATPSSGTISTTKARRAGLSNAVVIPPIRATT